MKRILILLLALLCLCTGCTAPQKSDKTVIVATNFAEFDFARAIAKDKADISLLIPPGSDMHSFEPTLKDIAGIENSDLFIYIGGDSDSQIERILEAISSDTLHTLRMSDFVCLAEHSENDSEHHHSHDDEAYDEHIWTSPENAEKMITAISETLCRLDPENEEFYKTNASQYILKIKEATTEIKSVIESSSNRTLAVADRNPYKYFTDYFSLNVVAAFSGCSEDTDADLKTVVTLIETVKKSGAKAVFVTELGNHVLADTVAENTGATVLTLHSYHNISNEDFNNGVTYVDLMHRNKSALLEGLN